MTPRLPWVQLAVVAWCGWEARELVTAWRSSPYDRFGWVALAIWLVPVATAAIRRDGGEPRPWPSFAGLALAFVGEVGALNHLIYAGLALALAGLRAPGLRWAAWVACAVVWWPVFGRALNALPPSAAGWIAAMAAAAGAAIVLVPVRAAATEAR